MRMDDSPHTPVITRRLHAAGLRCLRRLWLEVRRPELARTENGFGGGQERLHESVSAAARLLFPGGVQGSGRGTDPAEAAARTRVLLSSRPPALFDAAFLSGGASATVDIITPAGDCSWTLVAVKAAVSVKPEHVRDLEFQSAVVGAAGVVVGDVRVVRVNGEFGRPGEDELLRIESVASRVSASGDPAAMRRIEEMRDVLLCPDEPDVPLGRRCVHPSGCPFKAYCWRSVPTPSVFDIPRLSGDRRDELFGMRIYSPFDIPADYPLAAAEREHVELYRTGLPLIDREKIRSELDTIRFPIYFLDFETDSRAVPLHAGVRPFEPVPFQYSLHILRDPADAESGGAEPEHREYLHFTASDPRPEIAGRLVGDIGDDGTIVAYAARFEQRIVAALAESFPPLAHRLRGLLRRFRDLLPVVRACYRHPGFLGSYSLKSVLPVLVFGMSYAGMRVSSGLDAQEAWNRMIEASDPDVRDAAAGALREYCRKDTLAMVEIYRVLLKDAAPSRDEDSQGGTRCPQLRRSKS